MSASNPFQPGGSAGGFATSGGAFAALGNGDAGETSQAGDGEGGEEEENTGESIANAVSPPIPALNEMGGSAGGSGNAKGCFCCARNLALPPPLLCAESENAIHVLKKGAMGASFSQAVEKGGGGGRNKLIGTKSILNAVSPSIPSSYVGHWKLGWDGETEWQSLEGVL